MKTILTRIAILFSGAVLCGLGTPVFAAAQSQGSQQSVAEAARKAREQKQNSAPKATRVVTTDDIKPAAPSTTSNASQQTPGATPQPEATSDSATPPAAADSAQSKEERAAQLAALKKQLADAQSDVDVLQRELALQRDTFYANVNYARDTAGKDKLDQAQAQISDKQQLVEELKTKLAALGELVAPEPKQTRTPPNAAPGAPSPQPQQNPQ